MPAYQLGIAVAGYTRTNVHVRRLFRESFIHRAGSARSRKVLQVFFPYKRRYPASCLLFILREYASSLLFRIYER